MQDTVKMLCESKKKTWGVGWGKVIKGQITESALVTYSGPFLRFRIRFKVFPTLCKIFSKLTCTSNVVISRNGTKWNFAFLKILD